jgi:hypothetical protein
MTTKGSYSSRLRHSVCFIKKSSGEDFKSPLQEPRRNPCNCNPALEKTTPSGADCAECLQRMRTEAIHTGVFLAQTQRFWQA